MLDHATFKQQIDNLGSLLFEAFHYLALFVTVC